jgi:hypothetical protein
VAAGRFCAMAQTKVKFATSTAGGRMDVKSRLTLRLRVALVVLVAVTLGFSTATASAQAPAMQPAEPSAQIDTAPPDPPNAPGFIGTLGQWMQQSVATVGAGFGSMVGVIGQAGDAARSVTDGAATVAKGAASVARDTAATVGRLPATGFVSGREACLPAPNGAPDCHAAADAMCRTRGYDGGNSVDFETAEKCLAPTRVAGRTGPRVCTVENFVTRALCQ